MLGEGHVTPHKGRDMQKHARQRARKYPKKTSQNLYFKTYIDIVLVFKSYTSAPPQIPFWI